MFTIQQLLWLDLGLLVVLCVCVVMLMRRALQQGRAKRALENSLASAQAPITATPYVTSRSVPSPAASASMTHADVAAVFAPAYAVPETRRPLWSDTIQVVEADSWIDDVLTPEQPAISEPFLFSLEAPAEEPVVAEEEAASPELPREQVGILFLEDDQDIASLRLAKVREFAPRAKTDAVAEDKEHVAAVEFIDGVYADPIDGVPFTAGEEVIPCVCGMAYRMDTADWLRSEANGECVQCHRLLAAESIFIPEESQQTSMAQTA
ncbi:hypothetical protein [Terriglobus sp. RCC_193]|uniref:hypothetical protein n=1 Tax=Terriglobus sp. RCC_193 TaxID=3239218 RepID=UPI003526B1B4